MSDAPRWRRYLRFVRPNVVADVDEELHFHLAMRAERSVALGMSPDAARRDALTRFGDVAPVRSALLDHDRRRQSAKRRIEYLADVFQDVRFGLRSLRRAPGFAITAILTLALGIGANAAIYSVIEAIVLRPLPYSQPDRLVSIGSGSAAEYLALRARLKSFAQVAAYVGQTHPLDDGEEALRVEGAAITTNLLATLGVAPMLGRDFTDADAVLGNNAVLLLSHGLWQSRFGGAPAVLGTRVLVEGVPHTVIGVMPPSFHFPNRDVQYWQPYAFNPANVGLTWAVGGKSIIGRLAPGVTHARAAREVREVWPTLRSLNPLWDPGPTYRRDVVPTPLQDHVVGATSRVLWLLFGCVVLVLLIGCVNVANLLLARTSVRERELAVRVAMGGGRGRLMRQLVTESLLLSGLGALLGTALAFAAVRWLVSAMPAGVPRTQEIAVNGSVLLFTALIAIATGALFGIIPAWRATSHAGRAVAAPGWRVTAGPRQHRLSGLLIATEMALAVLVVVSAGLLVRSFVALRAVEPGFEPTRVIAARVSLPAAQYVEPARIQSVYSAIMERVAALPGVRHVAAVDKLPFAQTVWGAAVRVEGQFEDATRTLPDVAHLQTVTPDYFRAMAIPLRRGRTFTEADRDGQPPVAIVSESVVRKFWPDGDALGRRIGYAWESPWLTIVGVVPDTKQDSLRDTLSTSVYVPWRQRSRMSGTEMWVVARTAGPPGGLSAALHAVARDIDRGVAVSDVRTMDAVLSESMQRSRFTTALVAAFALTALLLGAVGVYGVMSFLVGQRTQEMGVRIALGAPRFGVVLLVVRRGVRAAMAGAVVGLIAALFSTRALASLLYGVSVTDPATFVTVPLVFLAVSIAASAVPARRATRVDPMTALRAE